MKVLLLLALKRQNLHLAYRWLLPNHQSKEDTLVILFWQFSDI